MADNCMAMDHFWLETQTRTRALQMSLSDGSSVSSPSLLLPPPPQASATRRTPLAAGRISKRKPRSSRRATTTFITADPANFRAMVQQVTGVRFADAAEPASEAVLWPEPQRSGFGFGFVQHGCLPTLDTSAFLLDREAELQQNEPDGGDSVGFGLEPVMSFPTLESWRVV